MEVLVFSLIMTGNTEECTVRLGKMFVLPIMAVALAACSFSAAGTGRVETAELEWSFEGKKQAELLIEVIRSAESTLDIAIYSLTNPDIVGAIRDAAKRGVAVRIITDRQQAGGKAQTEALKLLGSAGIPIKINSHSGLMHLKMTVADGKICTTGSFNYSKSAVNENDEMLMVVRNVDAARSFSEQFESMWRDEDKYEPVTYRIAQPVTGEPEKQGGADSSAAGSRKPLDREMPDEGTVYSSCAEARAAGKAPLHRGEPGYSPKMDGDGDGVACESP